MTASRLLEGQFQLWNRRLSFTSQIGSGKRRARGKRRRHGSGVPKLSLSAYCRRARGVGGKFWTLLEPATAPDGRCLRGACAGRCQTWRRSPIVFCPFGTFAVGLCLSQYPSVWTNIVMGDVKHTHVTNLTAMPTTTLGRNRS